MHFIIEVSNRYVINDYLLKDLWLYITFTIKSIEYFCRRVDRKFGNLYIQYNWEIFIRSTPTTKVSLLTQIT